MVQLNRHSKWRLELARTIAKRLQPFNGLRAITVGGSVARGFADAYSDLEMPLFWEEQPAEAVRQEIATTLEADTIHFSTRPAGEDNFLINGFQVDLWHIALWEAEAIFDQVLRQHDTSLKLSNFIDTLQHAIPLYGEGVMSGLQQQIAVCPETLAVRYIEEFLVQFRAKHLELHLIRQNPTLLYGTITETQRLIFLVLLALNGRFFPAFKWLYPTLENLPLKPAGVAQRFRDSFLCPPAEAIELARQLIDETLTLVNERFPQIDTASVSGNLTFARVAHETPVRLFSDNEPSGTKT